MRIAGGVLLIIVAVINLVVGLGYLVGGAAVGGGGKFAAAIIEKAEKDPNTTAEQRAELARQKAQMAQASEEVGSKAGLLAAFGAFLLVTVGTSIAGAVQLFRRKGATFIMVAAVLVIVGEIVGAIVLRFGVANIPGIVAAVLAFLGARSIGAKPAAAPIGSPAPM